MRHVITLTVLYLSMGPAWGQTPPTPNPSPQSVMKSTPQPQQPQAQYYQLVPVNAPVSTPAPTQYQTVHLPAPPVQYQTVQLAQQPVYQTVQLAQQPVQPVQYVQTVQVAQPAVYSAPMTSTYAVGPATSHSFTLGPGLVSLSLAHTGQFLTNTFGKSHQWTVQHSTMRQQMQAAPPATQLMTVSIPIQQAAPPVQMQLIQTPTYQQPTQTYKINAPSEAAPPPPVINPPSPTPTATPQTTMLFPPPKSHSLFSMLHQ